MRVTILTVGSRGDVQPYVAFGRGLRAAGHEVRIATHATFENSIREAGLDYARVGADPHELMKVAMPEWRLLWRNPFRFMRRMKEAMQPFLDDFLESGIVACEGSEAIVFSTFGQLGFHAAEQLGVPSCLAALQPATPTRAFAHPFVPPLVPLGGAGNRMTYAMNEVLAWWSSKKIINRWRTQRMGIAPLRENPFAAMRRRGVPTFYAYSPTILPKPADWDGNVTVTGYWFADEPEWTPPQTLVDFLNAGPPPVYVGFGSAFGHDAEKKTDAVIRALDKAKQRGVLLTGLGALAARPATDQILTLDSVSHTWLFPRVAGIVHHGGVGTVGAAFRSGVPSLGVPIYFDHPFWSARIAALGTGPKPVSFLRLSANRLAARIRELTSNGNLRTRAAEIGERVRAEDGVGNAVAAFQRAVT